MFSLAQHGSAPGPDLAEGLSLVESGQFHGVVASPPRFRLQKPALYLLTDLFRADWLGPRQLVAAAPLASISPAKQLLFTGETLDQFDLDVLLSCAAQSRSPGGLLVSPALLLKSLGLRHDECNRARLFDSLLRLHNGCLEVRKGGYRYLSRLLNRLLLDESTRGCLVEVNDEVVRTLGRLPRQGPVLQERQALGRRGLDKWLHGALLVFQAGFEAELDRLQALTGQARRTQRVFAQELAQSLERLAQAGLIAGYDILLDAPRPRMVVCGPRSRHLDLACGFFQQP